MSAVAWCSLRAILSSSVARNMLLTLAAMNTKCTSRRKAPLSSPLYCLLLIQSPLSTASLSSFSRIMRNSFSLNQAFFTVSISNGFSFSCCSFAGASSLPFAFATAPPSVHQGISTSLEVEHLGSLLPMQSLILCWKAFLRRGRLLFRGRPINRSLFHTRAGAVTAYNLGSMKRSCRMCFRSMQTLEDSTRLRRMLRRVSPRCLPLNCLRKSSCSSILVCTRRRKLCSRLNSAAPCALSTKWEYLWRRECLSACLLLRVSSSAQLLSSAAPATNTLLRCVSSLNASSCDSERTRRGGLALALPSITTNHLPPTPTFPI